MAQQKVRPRKKEAAPKKKNKKIIKYRKPLHINVGMIIFALIFVYMVFSVYTYIRRDKIQFYEVQEGSIVNNTDYTGIILREEEVKTADRSGYINYYIREGKTRLVIGIGCTGGKHRSVTLANELYEALLKNENYGIRIEHRDIGKDAITKAK